MNFNDCYFLNAFHKARFKDMARQNGRIYQSTTDLISAYVFSSSPELTSKTQGMLNDKTIDFDAILKKDLTAEERLLVQLAGNYYDSTRYKSPAVADLISGLSGESYTVMLNIFKMFN
ncbi:MAG: hypothetical protein RR310_03220 [Eubacterium sp.]